MPSPARLGTAVNMLRRMCGSKRGAWPIKGRRARVRRFGCHELLLQQPPMLHPLRAPRRPGVTGKFARPHAESVAARIVDVQFSRDADGFECLTHCDAAVHRDAIVEREG